MKRKIAKKLIKIILEEFDFEKVHDLMLQEDWRWFDIEGEGGGVPSVKALKQEARNLLKSVCYYGEDDDFSASGGLCAEKRGDTLELRFEYEVVAADENWVEE